MRIELSGSFCSSEGRWLTWSDLRFGMSRGYINANGVVDFAADSLTATSSEPHYELAAMRGGDSWSVDGCLERLELLDGRNIDNRKDHWSYLILLWVYHNQSIYGDPLSLAEEIYAEFDYPECMAPMIRYMPSERDADGGDVKLMENWRRLLIRCAETLTARSNVE